MFLGFFPFFFFLCYVSMQIWISSPYNFTTKPHERACKMFECILCEWSSRYNDFRIILIPFLCSYDVLSFEPHLHEYKQKPHTNIACKYVVLLACDSRTVALNSCTNCKRRWHPILVLSLSFSYVSTYYCYTVVNRPDHGNTSLVWSILLLLSLLL